MTAKLFEAARAQREEDRVTQSQEKDEIAEKAKKAAAKAGFDTGQPSTSKAGKFLEIVWEQDSWKKQYFLSWEK